jgi:ABC-type sugar transport system ATPase subunit
MIYVTHDQEEALSLGDRVAVLHQGVVQQADRPEVLYRRPANRFVAEFLGWPPLNCLEGRLVGEGGSLRLVDGPASLPVPACCAGEWQRFAGQKVTLGIRPEHVRLGPGNDQRGGGEVVLTMEVRLVERLGWARLVTLQQGAWTVNSLVEAGRSSIRPEGACQGTGPSLKEGGPPTGAVVRLSLAQAHLFDQATGRALAHGLPGDLGGEEPGCVGRARGCFGGKAEDAAEAVSGTGPTFFFVGAPDRRIQQPVEKPCGFSEVGA